MLSRRIIRIKVLQALYAHYNNEGATIQLSEKQLFHSLEKSYELYIMLLLLPVCIRDYAHERIDLARQKKVPTYEDLNPITRFIDNKIIAQVDENAEIKKYCNSKRLSWVNYPELVKNLYNELTCSGFYQKYIDNPSSPGYIDDKKLVNNLYTEIIAPNDGLYASLEEQSIYWNDEPEFIISIICKTLDGFKQSQGAQANLMPLFKNEDDRLFTRDLFRKAILNGDDLKLLIKKHTLNCEIERIAFMDVLLIQLAITEIMEFSQIPIKVSMNEYIEIAKFYSTEKSNVFLNGIIDQIVNHLKEDGKIIKTGRGLVDE